jgi:hypothetical protein
VPFGSYLMCFRFLQVTVSFLRTGELPHHDHGHVEGIDEEEQPLTAPGNEDKIYRMDDNLHPRETDGGNGNEHNDHLRPAGRALMLTGMPISISLGLTVLTFLFFHDPGADRVGGLKLFTGIEKFEIMAIPFFILAGNFLTHGGVAKRMIRLRHRHGGSLHGGLGLGGVLACALFAAVSGSSPATVVAIGSILLPAMVKAGFPTPLRRRRHHHVRRPGHPDPALDRHGDVRGVDQHLGWRAVHGRRHPGAWCWRFMLA